MERKFSRIRIVLEAAAAIKHGTAIMNKMKNMKKTATAQLHSYIRALGKFQLKRNYAISVFIAKQYR